jgi:hypothetical protein
VNWEYVAGFFDGKGHVGVYQYSYTRAGKQWAVIDITHTYQQVLEEIFKFLNAEGIECKPPRKNAPRPGETKPSFTLRITRGQSIIRFLEQIKNRIIVKEKAILEVLSKLEN